MDLKEIPAGRRAHIVDDEPEVREALTLLLSDRGHRSDGSRVGGGLSRHRLALAAGLRDPRQPPARPQRTGASQTHSRIGRPCRRHNDDGPRRRADRGRRDEARCVPLRGKAVRRRGPVGRRRGGAQPRGGRPRSSRGGARVSFPAANC